MTLIGKSLPRIDALDKVLGKAVFPADMKMEGELHALAVRSPHPSARIKGIDMDAARRHPGVVTVLTAKDIDGPNGYGWDIPDKPVLCGDRVRCVGDPVALVVADTRRAAMEAAGLVKVDYEPLPAVFDPIEAEQPGAPRIHGDSNVIKNFRIRRGDLAEGFAKAHVIVEETYTTPFIEHAFLQPEAGLAAPDGKGGVNIWVATQWGVIDRSQTAHALGLPLDRVRIIQTCCGGAFGGREDISVQILLALAALKTGKPVKMVFSREESVISRGKRHPFRMTYKTGADREGKLTALEVKMVCDAGAYASTSGSVLTTAMIFAAGPYEVPNVSVDGKAVLTNNPWTCAMRGFGSPQVCYAYEGQMDRLAAALGMDPVTIRRRNLIQDGSITATGHPLLAGVGIKETLEKVMQVSGWNPESSRIFDAQKGVSENRSRGVGIACGWKNVGLMTGFDEKSTATVEIHPDKYVVRIDVSDAGHGTLSSMAQIAANELDVPISKVQVIAGDTATLPDGGTSSATRQVHISGKAVLLAAREVMRIWTALNKSPEVLPLSITRTHSPRGTSPLSPETGQSIAAPCYGYAVQLVEVEVDRETGGVEVLRVVSGHDVGKVINRQGVEGQADGGLVMGMGYALMEDYHLEEGKSRSRDLSTYMIPTSMDIPDIEYAIVEKPDPVGPYGAKGIGELPLLPMAPAITNAIYDATGIWCNQLPIKRERLKVSRR